MAAPSLEVRKGGDVEEPLDEELLAEMSLRSWTAAPSLEVRKGGVVGVVQPINKTGSGVVALDGCGACRGAHSAWALPGLDELEEPSDEELLAVESQSRTGAPSHEARPRLGLEGLEAILAEELLGSLRSWAAVPFQQVHA